MSRASRVSRARRRAQNPGFDRKVSMSDWFWAWWYLAYHLDSTMMSNYIVAREYGREHVRTELGNAFLLRFRYWLFLNRRCKGSIVIPVIIGVTVSVGVQGIVLLIRLLWVRS